MDYAGAVWDTSTSVRDVTYAVGLLQLPCGLLQPLTLNPNGEDSDKDKELRRRIKTKNVEKDS